MLKTRAVHTAGERPLQKILQKNIYAYINFWSLSLFLLSLCGDSFHFPDTLQLKFPPCEVNLLLNLMSIVSETLYSYCCLDVSAVTSEMLIIARNHLGFLVTDV